MSFSQERDTVHKNECMAEQLVWKHAHFSWYDFYCKLFFLLCKRNNETKSPYVFFWVSVSLDLIVFFVVVACTVISTEYHINIIMSYFIAFYFFSDLLPSSETEHLKKCARMTRMYSYFISAIACIAFINYFVTSFSISDWYFV